MPDDASHNSGDEDEIPAAIQTVIQSARRDRLKAPRDNAFLADRAAAWFPDASPEQVLEAITQLSDDEYWQHVKNVFQANTSVNLEYGAKACAEHGWFIDMNFPGASVGTIGAMISGDKVEEANSHFEKYYEGRRNDIEAELVTRFPHREKLLRTAFRLHDAGTYEASVPLFLIQVDGISHDIYGKNLFLKRKKKPLIRPKIESKEVDWIWEALSGVLLEVLPLARSVDWGDQAFNRHMILHGSSLDYGMKSNSLRAISLLSFLQGMSEYEEMVRKRNEAGPG